MRSSGSTATRRKSLAQNATLNLIRTILSIIFPLITFPYASRVLMAENLGKVTFASSIISYFVMIADLGIRTYAIREGARVRDNQELFEKFANEVFSINLISTIVSYLLLILVYCVSTKLKDYRLLLLVQSFNIIGTTMGVDWLYVIHEDYVYTTVRSVVVHVCSLILLFAFVHKPEDYIVYAGISTFSATAGNIYNFVHSRKITHLCLVGRAEQRIHLKPILILFAMTVATTIYVNSDITMLGYFNGDYFVGLYNISTKIYSTIKILISACIVVALPRLSNAIAENDRGKYQREAGAIFDAFIAVLLPIVLGGSLCAKEIVMIVSGAEYIDSATSFRLLSFSLFFSVIAIYLTHVILLPHKKEKTLMYATICSAAVNFLLNIIVLPSLKHVGAALTTVIAEAIVCLWQFSSVHFKLPFKVNVHNLVCVIAGCACIGGICVAVDLCGIIAYYNSFLIKFAVSVIVYISILVLGKCPLISRMKK